MNIRKIWRNFPRRFASYTCLFVLGILTCLFCLQILQIPILTDSELSEGPLYYDFSDAATPCDSTSNNGGSRSKTRRRSVPEYPKSNPQVSPNNYYEEIISEHIEIRNRDEIQKQSPPKLLIENLPQSPGHHYPHRTSLNSHRHDGDGGSGGSIDPGGPTVWVITPTFYRPEQKPELTRLAQALIPVSSFVHWIVVDDVSQGSEASLRDLEAFLGRFPLAFTLLRSLPSSGTTKVIGKPRGVGGRRAAIAWLRHNAKDGVVYFADDDNTYDSEIFRQMRTTQKVTMWPVGLVTSFGVSSPIVKNGRIVGFYDGWNGLRKFPVDMAGFAINIRLFLAKPKGNMPYVAGYEEDELLKTLGVSVADISPLANNCTEIFVWHTKTTRNPWPIRPSSLKPEIEANTNLKELLKTLPSKAWAGPNSSTKSVQNENFSILKFIFGEN